MPNHSKAHRVQGKYVDKNKESGSCTSNSCMFNLLCGNQTIFYTSLNILIVNMWYLHTNQVSKISGCQVGILQFYQDIFCLVLVKHLDPEYRLPLQKIILKSGQSDYPHFPQIGYKSTLTTSLVLFGDFYDGTLKSRKLLVTHL